MQKFVLISLLAFAGASNAAEDVRILATLPTPAVEVLRDEMRANMLALNEILVLIAEGKVKEAGIKAEQELGVSSMGRHRDKPFDARPGPHMPPEMHALGMEGHKSASEFARIAASGERNKTVDALPRLTSACVSCHAVYRIR
ncbi:MAG: cytochrome C [Propionivibrio sp.]|nr:cytochrome C [Propionivibrio sp.]